MFFPSALRLAIAAACLAASTSAAAIDISNVERRQTDPAPGHTHRVDFDCKSIMVPELVSGTSSAINQSTLKMTNPDGSTASATVCQHDDNCLRYCRFDDGSLAGGPITYLNACLAPGLGGCSMSFTYNGQSYSTSDGSQNGQCGVSNDLIALGVDSSATCYVS